VVTKQEALELIVQQMERGELVFPTNMAAALKLQRELDDPECHLDTAAELVLAEPLVAARLVSIANSAAYSRVGGSVSNVRSAASMLGINRLRALVAAIVVRQLSSEITDASIRSKADQLWQHCAHVAALAKVLAREFTTVDPEMALFTGVVHEIDGFYLLSRAQEFPALLESDPSAIETPSRAHLARHIMAALKIPRPVAAAVQSLHTSGSLEPPESAGDVLSLANRLAPVPSPLTELAAASDQTQADPLDFVMGAKTLRTVLDASADERQAMTAALLL